MDVEGVVGETGYDNVAIPSFDLFVSGFNAINVINEPLLIIDKPFVLEAGIFFLF